MSTTDFEGKWIQVSDTLVPREKHSVELLPNGEVLVLGGQSYEASRTSEVYDPITKKFSQSGKMMVAREWGHKNVCLQNGKILVIGGSEMTVQTTEIEMYDPSSGKFSHFGSMCLPRENAVVVLLNENSLLIAGGYGTTDIYYQDPANNRCLSEVELFNLQTLESSEIRGMNTARTGHTGTLLQDGRVLIVGGIAWSRFGRASVAQESVEIFNLKTHEFSLTGSMDVGRTDHTATLLYDGRVLIAGGHDGDYNAFNSAEIYNPMTGTFSTISAMSIARFGHTATLLKNGYVLIAGGEGKPSFNKHNSVEIYDPKVNVFHQVNLMNVCRDDHTATLLKDGNVLIIGGQGNDGETLRSVELWHWHIYARKGEDKMSILDKIRKKKVNKGGTITSSRI